MSKHDELRNWLYKKEAFDICGVYDLPGQAHSEKERSPRTHAHKLEVKSCDPGSYVNLDIQDKNGQPQRGASFSSTQLRAFGGMLLDIASAMDKARGDK